MPRRLTQGWRRCQMDSPDSYAEAAACTTIAPERVTASRLGR